MNLRIACVQFNPRVGELEKNIAKVKKLLGDAFAQKSTKEKEVDLIVLPELALTGYNFDSPQHIKPFLEPTPPGDGVSFLLAQELSKQYKCFTLIGYPETTPQQVTHNSCLLTAPLGSLLVNYRKTFLYETDKQWGCHENPEKPDDYPFFPKFDIIWDKSYYLNRDGEKDYKPIRTALGICMDMNPYEFTAPFNKFEFSLSCLINQVKLILFPTAWLSSLSPSIEEGLSSEEKLKLAKPFEKFWDTETSETSDDPCDPTFIAHEPLKSTNDYWILRFFPFLNHPMNQLPSSKVTVVINNRVGVEKDILYGGSSTIFQMDLSIKSTIELTGADNESVEVLGCLGMGEESVLIRDVTIE
ncbi:Carbon-nitrogen hydrolase [Scheffersomyces spartinae]|uniref:Carbon-nitrogen hydrolase n=1 Tax=Scheffersomyces spartinae TaxID=45513 RepID=A0A9P7VAX8_9ASCO|nr:Carbon-nitrogen hydrolase [Scheffersomyces spartinae]KAG7194633.1 Carbon-nitrogen hydrolase [Scheffersomyces spartinae]